MDTFPRESCTLRKDPIFAAVLLTAAAGVYAGAIDGEFVFDDKPAIVDNPALSNIGNLFSRNSPQEARPTVFASLAFNYALGGLNPLGYHLFNLFVHLCVVSVLYALLRQTLALPRFQNTFENRGHALAFAVCLLFALHPLQAECVSYVFQRSESMQALFYLLGMLFYLKYALHGGLSRVLGLLALHVVTVLGMGSKAVFVTLPAVLLAYDRVFLSPSFRETLRSRGAVLLSVMITIGCFGAAASGVIELATGYTETTPDEDVPFSVGYASGPLEYCQSQPTVVTRYLKLAVWPEKLCLDYRLTPIHDPVVIARSGFVLLLLLAGTAVLLARHPPLGFCSAFVFIVLAPTSLYWRMELMFTYRMYLPLAGILCFTVFSADRLLQGWVQRGLLSPKGALAVGATCLVIFAGALGARTVVRNRDFQNQFTLYKSVVANCPDNPRGRYNFANRLMEQARTHRSSGRHEDAAAALDEAISHYKEAVRLFPMYIDARVNLAVAYGISGQLDASIAELEQTIIFDPAHAKAMFNLAMSYQKRALFHRRIGRHASAEADFEKAASYFQKSAALRSY